MIRFDGCCYPIEGMMARKNARRWCGGLSSTTEIRIDGRPNPLEGLYQIGTKLYNIFHQFFSKLFYFFMFWTGGYPGRNAGAIGALQAWSGIVGVFANAAGSIVVVSYILDSSR